ncbi:MAG: hypothetical protein KC422_24410, partial [Trueperaceae bacterium]|nr:hypothetical protein [Trueperaceae bacterium]
IDAPFKQLKNLARVARVVAPAATKLPIKFLYPTGESQEHTKANDWRAKYFVAAELIAGDFHLIRRYAPEDLSEKIILTNTTTIDDLELIKARGVKMLITTTPRLNGRSLSTNMLEAAFVALAGKFPLESKDYENLIKKSGIKPDIQEF